MGTVNITNIAGFVMSYEQEEYPGAGVIECDGVYGGSCGVPIPDLKNRFQATWATPWNVNASLIWRHVGALDQEFTDQPNDIDSYSYFDVSASWDVTDYGLDDFYRYGLLLFTIRNGNAADWKDYATLRLGINNLLDEKPPFVYQGVTARENGNTYPGIYDPLGQYLFIGGTVQF